MGRAVATLLLIIACLAIGNVVDVAGYWVCLFAVMVGCLLIGALQVISRI